MGQRSLAVLLVAWLGLQDLARGAPGAVLPDAAPDGLALRYDAELHEIKSPIILQPGPAALTAGLDALHAIIGRWASA